METKKKEYLKAGKAADYVGCTRQTLINYETKGVLIPEQVMPSGHRRYSTEQLDAFIKNKMEC